MVPTRVWKIDSFAQSFNFRGMKYRITKNHRPQNGNFAQGRMPESLNLQTSRKKSSIPADVRPRSVANVNLRHNAESCPRKAPPAPRQMPRLALLHQVDGAAAKSAAGQPRANQARQILRQLHHRIGLNATGFKVLL
jgi:hypothetical protein